LRDIAGFQKGGSRSSVIEIMRHAVDEDRLIEQFVAHSAIERLADPVLHRLAWRDEMPDDPALLRPGEHCVRGELGSTVGDDQVRPAAPATTARSLRRLALQR
jgi:hypothetical protein